jgi:hypothetical protein
MRSRAQKDAKCANASKQKFQEQKKVNSTRNDQMQKAHYTKKRRSCMQH